MHSILRGTILIHFNWILNDMLNIEEIVNKAVLNCIQKNALEYIPSGGSKLWSAG